METTVIRCFRSSSAPIEAKMARAKALANSNRIAYGANRTLAGAFRSRLASEVRRLEQELAEARAHIQEADAELEYIDSLTHIPGIDSISSVDAEALLDAFIQRGVAALSKATINA